MVEDDEGWRRSRGGRSRARRRSPEHLPGRRRRRPARPRLHTRALARAIRQGHRTVVVTSSRPVTPRRSRLAHDPPERPGRGYAMRARSSRRTVGGEPTAPQRSELDDRPSRMIAIRSPSRSASGRSWVITPSSCRFLLQAHYLVLHVAPDQRVERAERLVVEQHLRVDPKARAGRCCMRKLVWELAGRVFEADELPAPQSSRAARPSRRPAPRGRRRCRARSDGEQTEVLKHHRRGGAEAAGARRGTLRDVPAVRLDAPGVARSVGCVRTSVGCRPERPIDERRPGTPRTRRRARQHAAHLLGSSTGGVGVWCRPRSRRSSNLPVPSMTEPCVR